MNHYRFGGPCQCEKRSRVEDKEEVIVQMLGGVVMSKPATHPNTPLYMPKISTRSHFGAGPWEPSESHRAMAPALISDQTKSRQPAVLVHPISGTKGNGLVIHWSERDFVRIAKTLVASSGAPVAPVLDSPSSPAPILGRAFFLKRGLHEFRS